MLRSSVTGGEQANMPGAYRTSRSDNSSVVSKERSFVVNKYVLDSGSSSGELSLDDSETNKSNPVKRTSSLSADSMGGKVRRLLEFADWKDVSKPLPASEIENYAMTKVSVKKRWIGDAGASAQKQGFINRNNRDKHYEFTETFYLKGYCDRFLGFLNIEDIPCLANETWYTVGHVTVVFALPYRMCLSSRTGKSANGNCQADIHIY